MDGSATPGRRRLVHMIWLCGPLVLWLAVVAVASTDIASEAHTKAWLVSFIHLFARGYGAGSSGSSSGLGALMWAIRKTAHVIEYGVLGFLLARGVKGLFPGYARGAGRELLGRIALGVLPCGLLVALADEFHQTLVRSRMGSPRDVAFDLVGLSLGVLAAWLVWRRDSA